MPNVFGRDVTRVDDIVAAFRRHGDAVRGTYRARYVFDDHASDPYSGAALERPPALAGNPPGVVYPWEQVILSAAQCAGSDYPMLAEHFGVPIRRTEFVVECEFDPRGEFDGLAGFVAPASAAGCYLALHVAARLTSDADTARLEEIHRRVLRHNMVLGALRGIPRTDGLELVRIPAAASPEWG